MVFRHGVNVYFRENPNFVSLKDWTKKFAMGLTVPQEYCCLDVQGFQQPLTVWLTLKNQTRFFDVTQTHLFLGYKPLIMALFFDCANKDDELVKEADSISLHLGEPDFIADDAWRSFPASKNSVGRLVLKKIHEEVLGNHALLLYEGEVGEHSFLNSFYQVVNRHRKNLKKSTPNNVDLPGNLQDQVQIAYAIPRVISIITVSDGRSVNMFPTDLHGAVGDRFYAGSLRKGGRVNHQVAQYKRIVISEVKASFYKQAYNMGKNHMQEPGDEQRFPLSKERSGSFNFPLPEAVVGYRELEEIRSFDKGIHRIHYYKLMGQQLRPHGSSCLGHIHQYYAQWRIDQGIPTSILFR